MSRVIPIVGGILIFLLGVGIGAVSAEEPEIAQPTPQVIVVTPEPQEQPTPRVETVTETVTETVEVEVARQSCIDAIDSLDAAYGQLLDQQVAVLSAYVDYPDEDLVEFGHRFEDLVETWADPLEVDWDAVDACRN